MRKSAEEASKILVRVKPYNSKRRHVVRVWVHGPSGKRFEERKGWYSLDSVKDARLIEALRGACQIEGDLDSPPVFDICTVDQAKLIDKSEAVINVRRATAENANDLSTADFGRRKAEDAAAVPEDRRTATLARLKAKPAGARGMRASSAEEERTES